MPNYLVQILLSTYNGASYIKEQLNSILEQDTQEWQLLIRDDGSSDETMKIVADYVTKYPQKIVLLEGGEGGNASRSFMTMLANSDAPYIMFCDQDDVWKPDKIKNSLKEIKLLEKKNPIALVYSDMTVVDRNLNMKHSSFLAHQRLKPSWSNYVYACFAQSMAAGCSMIFTRALVEIMHPIKAPLFQHDHWVLMHASNYGVVKFLDQSTMLYRQHTQNAVGSHEIDLGYFTRKIAEFKKIVARWRYIKIYFRPKVSLYKILFAKFWINTYRLLKI